MEEYDPTWLTHLLLWEAKYDVWEAVEKSGNEEGLLGFWLDLVAYSRHMHQSCVRVTMHTGTSKNFAGNS